METSQKLNQPKPSFLTKTSKYPREIGYKRVEFTIPDAVVLQDFYGYSSLFHYTGKGDQDYDFYLSGAMTGKEGFNYEAFNHVARRLRKVGFRVFNPAENFGGDSSLDRDIYMRKDIKAVTRCSNILIMPDSYESEGVATELNVALGLGMGIYFMTTHKDAQLPLTVKLQ